MIRVIQESDFDAYIALRQRSLRECPLAFSAAPDDDFASSRESLRAQTAMAPSWVIFGAFDGDALVGALGFIRKRRVKAEHRAQIWGVYVAPEHRGRGFGEQLIGAVIEHARAQSVDWLDLDVTSAAPEAQRLYRRMGFQEWGTRTDVLRHEGHVVDEHHMALRIV